MINTFDKVIEYLKSFYNPVEKGERKTDIKYGNILFNDSDYLNNIKRLCHYVRTISDILEKCVKIYSDIQLPTIPSETPTPSPSPADISIPIPIPIPSETESQTEIQTKEQTETV